MGRAGAQFQALVLFCTPFGEPFNILLFAFSAYLRQDWVLLPPRALTVLLSVETVNSSVKNVFVTFVSAALAQSGHSVIAAFVQRLPITSGPNSRRHYAF